MIPFELVSANSILLQNRRYGLFIVATSFYNAPFIKKVFDLDEDDVELFCCVIAKHNIRTKNNHVPVINLKTLIDLFSSQSIINIFHIIRNREFETHSPTGISFTHKTVKYGDYIFKIPAICFE